MRRGYTIEGARQTLAEPAQPNSRNVQHSQELIEKAIKDLEKLASDFT